MKKSYNKGITLIALVITITIILILATVSINMLTGDKGILNILLKTKKKVTNVNQEEALKLAISELIIEDIPYENLTPYILSEKLNKYFNTKDFDTIYYNLNKVFEISFANNSNYYIDSTYTIKSSSEIELPQEYQRVEYIECLGNQYIDTNVHVDETTEFYLKCSYTKLSSTYLNGIGHSDSTRFFMGVEHNMFTATIGNNISAVAQVADYDVHEFLLSNKKLSFSIDGEKKAEWNEKKITNASIGIGARISGNFYYCYEKIYCSKLWQNDVLVRNLVPCLRKIDQKPGMYDLIQKKFYINKGTYDFSYGNLVY